MKLGALLKHIPVYQEVILMENLKEFARGKANHKDITQYDNKTVGLIIALDNQLIIKVYTR